MGNVIGIPGVLIEVPSDGGYRELDDLLPATRRAVEVVNRSLNLQSVTKTVLLTGSHQSGRTYAVMTLADHLNTDLTSTHGKRRMFRLSKQVHAVLMTKNDSPDSLNMQFLAQVREKLHDYLSELGEYPILYADNLADAIALSGFCQGVSLVAELNSDDANTFMKYRKDDQSSIDVVNFDELDVTWGDMQKELVRVDETVFSKTYDSRFTPRQIGILLRMINREIDDSGEYRSRDIMILPIGVPVDILEHVHLKAMEKRDDGGSGEFTVSDAKFRKYVAEVIDEHPDAPSTQLEEQNVIRISIPGLTGGGLTGGGADLDDDLSDMMSNSDDGKSKKQPHMDYSDVHTLGERMRAKVIHQDAAINQIVDAIKIDAAGLNEKNRPVASLLFVGPSGVGKTEVARVLSEELFTGPAKMLRLDMSEYSDHWSITKLFGSAPGYVGSDEGGQLTNFVMENPQSIILLDEAEKAHPKVWNSFLQVFDAGRMTDARGIVVDFSNTVIIMTSNIGNNENLKGKAGFGLGGDLGRENRAHDRENVTRKAYEKYFLPEFIGRLDAIVQFNQLTHDDLKQIVGIQIGRLAGTVSKNHPDYELDYELTKDVNDYIINQSNTDKYGARQLKKTIKKDIMLPLADYFIDKAKPAAETPVKGKRKQAKPSPKTLVLTLDKTGGGERIAITERK